MFSSRDYWVLIDTLTLLEKYLKKISGFAFEESSENRETFSSSKFDPSTGVKFCLQRILSKEKKILPVVHNRYRSTDAQA